MSTTEISTPTPRFGWLPKLLLWALVIAIGVLYLASMNRHREEAESQAVAEGKAPPAKIAAPPPPPVDVETAEGPESTAVVVAPDLEPGRRVETDRDPGQDGPVQAAEAEAFASSVMTAESAPAETGSPDAAVQLSAEARAPRPAVPAEAPPLKPAPSKLPPPAAGAVAHPGSAAGPSAPGERSAAMRSGASLDSTGPDLPPVSPVPSTEAASGNPADATLARPGLLPQETLEQRRARIRAEYEAMYRAARGPVGRGWGGYPPPAATPYGHPVGPDYRPPGYPWGYLPRREAP